MNTDIKIETLSDSDKSRLTYIYKREFDRIMDKNAIDSMYKIKTDINLSNNRNYIDILHTMFNNFDNSVSFVIQSNEKHFKKYQTFQKIKNDSPTIDVISLSKHFNDYCDSLEGREELKFNPSVNYYLKEFTKILLNYFLCDINNKEMIFGSRIIESDKLRTKYLQSYCLNNKELFDPTW